MGRCRQLTWIRRMTTTMTTAGRHAATTPTTTTLGRMSRNHARCIPQKLDPGALPSIYITRCPHIVMRKFTLIVLSRRALRAGKQYLCNRSTDVRSGELREIVVLRRKWNRERARRVKRSIIPRMLFHENLYTYITPLGDTRGEKVTI